MRFASLRAPFRAAAIALAALVAVPAIPGTVTDAAAQMQTKRFLNPDTGRWETRKVVRRASRSVARKFNRQTVRLNTSERPGTIIVDTRAKFLYHVQPGGKATRYGVGVGRDGFGWNGVVKVGRKAKWPSWTPPAEMIAREAAAGNNIPRFVPGGKANPLGARALYLYEGGRDTIFRIHGTNQPWTIGLNMSSGCIRMMNHDVEHLYSNAPKGTKVVVIGPDGRGAPSVFRPARG